MAITVMLSVEGVLAEDAASLAQASPIDSGTALFNVLRSGFHVCLSSVEPDEALVRRWLTTSCGIRPDHWARLLVSAHEESVESEERIRHAMTLRAAGYDLRWVIDPNPWVARGLLELGITPMCCPHPYYSRPSFLPDSGTGGMGWDQIEEQVLGQRRSILGDQRLVPDTALASDEEEVQL